MGFVIGLIVGICLGAAIAYFLTAKKTTAQSASVQDLQRQLDLADSEYERKLLEASSQIRRDYEAQLRAAQTEPASPPSPAPAPPAPVAEPIAASAPPEIAEPPASEPPAPVAATVPAPMPQPVMTSPDVPVPPARKSISPAAPQSTQNPNALLADSYSPDAAVRCGVATAIATVLPAASPAEKARWFPILGRLARDPNATVRLPAVQALKHMPAAQRLPLLRRAVRDSDPAIVQAASAILAQAKGRSPAPRTPQKRRLPKNR